MAAAQIERFFEAKIDDIRRTAQDAVEDATIVGHDKMIQIIESSTTPTGEDRAGRGGHPGRIETGNMVDDVESNIDVLEHGDLIRGSFGWISDLAAYYGYQEDGTDHIRAMHSVRQSYIEAREHLLARLTREGF